MGAWAYCDCLRWGSPLNYPTPEQILDPTKYTCKWCGKEHDPRVTKEELILSLIERIEKIENHLWPENEE